MINGFPGPGYSLWNNCILAAKVILLFLVNRMNAIRKGAYWGFLVLGVFLFYLAFRNIPIEELKAEIATVRPVYLLLLLIPSWGGQFLRAWRWQLLLGKEVRYASIYHSLLFGYFVNLAVPRLGEFSRCASVESLGGPSFGKSLGTVVIERITDLFFLVLVSVLAFFMQSTELKNWMDTELINPIDERLKESSLGIVIGFIMALVICVFVYKMYMAIEKRLNARIRNLIDQVKDGLKSLLRFKPYTIFLFVLLSSAIWVCYFFTTWLWFQALPAASGASFGMAFTVMVVGSLVKTLPIQGGGMGAYHAIIGALLGLYGLGALSSSTFALLNHGYQTVFYLLFGGFSAIWIAWKKKK